MNSNLFLFWHLIIKGKHDYTDLPAREPATKTTNNRVAVVPLTILRAGSKTRFPGEQRAKTELRAESSLKCRSKACVVSCCRLESAGFTGWWLAQAGSPAVCPHLWDSLNTQLYTIIGLNFYTGSPDFPEDIWCAHSRDLQFVYKTLRDSKRLTWTQLS